MPPKTRGSLDADTLEQLRSISREELKEQISRSIDPLIKDVNIVVSKLDNIEKSINDLNVFKSSTDLALQNQELRIAELQHCVNKLADYVVNVASELSSYMLDLDNHSRKWSLIIQGIEGPAHEAEAATRKKCVDLATKMGVTSDHVKKTNLAACHRLSQSANAGIIIRFCDLRDRDAWLNKARNLSKSDKISLAPDLPPKLRPLKTDLLNQGKDLPEEAKKSAKLKHLKSCPYIIYLKQYF